MARSRTNPPGTWALSLAGGLLCSCAAMATPPQGLWTHAGNTSARNALTSAPLPSIAQPTWTRSTDEAGRVISFRWQATPIVSPTLVFVVGSVRIGSVDVLKLFAVARATGAIAWSQALPNASAGLGSQGSPAYCPRRDEVYVCADASVRAFRAFDGVPLWQAALSRVVVNASPLLTSDLGVVVGAGAGPQSQRVPTNRLFISDYDFDASGPPGAVSCINIDALHPTANPFQPGQVVWSFPLGGTSGNSAAYVPAHQGGAGLVYVASAGEPDLTPGLVLALPANATTLPTPAWQTSNTLAQGFFAGTSVALGPTGQLEVLASSYAFFDLGNTLRLDARTGQILGDSPTNRSSSVPIALPRAATGEVRVLLSAGYDGFGSVPSLLMLRSDMGLFSQLWDSWTTASRRMAGWNHQPAVSIAGGRALALVGTIASGPTTTPAQKLEVIDPSVPPGSASFAVQQTNSPHLGVAGGSPALAGLNAYSIGAAGLVAFGPAWTGADVDASERIAIDDLAVWHAGQGARDVDASGTIDANDQRTLTLWLRWQEREQLLSLRAASEVSP